MQVDVAGVTAVAGKAAADDQAAVDAVTEIDICTVVLVDGGAADIVAADIDSTFCFDLSMKIVKHDRVEAAHQGARIET